MKPPALLIVLAATLLAPAAGGCASAPPNDPGVPKEAVLLPGDHQGGKLAGGSLEAETWQPDVGGALYVYDATGGGVSYSGAVAAGDSILVYPTGVAVAGRRKWKGGRTWEEKRVTAFDPSRTYRVYFHSGGTPVNPTPPPDNIPTTRPYQIRERLEDPAGILRPDKPAAGR